MNDRARHWSRGLANGGPHVGAYEGCVVTGLYIDNELGIGSTIKDSAGVS